MQQQQQQQRYPTAAMVEAAAPTAVSLPLCVVVLCEVASAGRSPRSGQPLCPHHLKREHRRVQALGTAALRVLAAAPASLSELERQRRRLAADEAELEQQFQRLGDRLRHWRERVIGDAAGELGRLEARMRALGEAAAFAETSQRQADGGNWRQLFQLLDMIGDSVDFLADCETPASEAASRRIAGCLAEAEAASADLQADMASLLAGPPPVLGPLPARVWRIAVCDNTAGFWVNSDGAVVRSRLAPTSGGAVRLARVCVVAAFHVDDAPDHLALMGLDEAVAGRIQPPVRWSSQVYSLRCDSADQLLFLSQGRTGISVVDLAGRLRRRVTPASLGLNPRTKLTGLCLTPGKLYVLSYKEHRILAVRRDTWALLASIDVAGCYTAEFFTESLAALAHGRLLLTDWAGHAVWRIDAETGRVIDRLPSDSAAAAASEAAAEDGSVGAFSSPYDVLADRRGRLYVVDVAEHAVRLLAPDGRRCLRTFSDSLSAPVSLDLWEGDAACDWLLVANSNQQQISVYRVAKDDEGESASKTDCPMEGKEI